MKVILEDKEVIKSTINDILLKMTEEDDENYNVSLKKSKLEI